MKIKTTLNTLLIILGVCYFIILPIWTYNINEFICYTNTCYLLYSPFLVGKLYSAYLMLN